jgi:hypothetical protein
MPKASSSNPRRRRRSRGHLIPTGIHTVGQALVGVTRDQHVTVMIVAPGESMRSARAALREMLKAHGGAT